MNKKAEMISLNDDLLTDFLVEGLEERLETDPLMLGGLYPDDGVQQTAECFCSPICNEII